MKKTVTHRADLTAKDLEFWEIPQGCQLKITRTYHYNGETWVDGTIDGVKQSYPAVFFDIQYKKPSWCK